MTVATVAGLPSMWLQSLPVWVLLGSSVELKRRPIVGFPKDSIGVQQSQLRCAKGDIWTPAVLEFAIEMIHENWSGRVAHFPQGADYAVRPSTQKCPREADNSLACVSANPGAI